MTPTTSPPEPDVIDEPDGSDAPETSRPLFVVAAVACVIALVAAIVAGTLWFFAAQESGAATARDDALTGARQAAINLNSVDSNNLDQTFADIESSITGDELTNGLNDTKDQFREQFSTSGVVTTATVEHAALVGFSADDRTAESLVVLQTNTVKPDGEERYQSTLRLELTDVDGVWKATRIQPIGQRIPLDVPTTQDPAATPDPAAPVDPATPAPTGGG